MNPSHAVVWTDRHKAQVLRFDTEHVLAQKVKAQSHHARQQQAPAQTEHEFFDDLCLALAGAKEVLITGPGAALDEFRSFVAQKRPGMARRIVGYEVADQPTQGHLVAFALQYFARYDFVNSRR
jgi:stalled ribosome rescue protein Dom34